MSETTEFTPVETPSLDHQPPPPETEPNTTERQLTPRERMMAEIATNAQREREREEAQGAVYDQEARERGEAYGDPDPPEPEPAPVVVAPAPEPVAPPAPAPEPPREPALLTLPNGMQVTPDQAMQLAHMGFVAHQALSQPVPPPPAPPQLVVDDSVLADAVQKMQFGSPEEGKAALARLVQHVVTAMPAQQQIDPAQIGARAAQDALAHLQFQHDTATVRAEFPEIFTDPQRALEAHAEVNAIRFRDQQLGRPRPDIDVYREAGQRVYAQHSLSRPGSDVAPQTALQAAPTVQPRADVEERKRAAPRNPQPVDRRAAQPAAPRAPTGSEIVAKMRTQRGYAALT